MKVTILDTHSIFILIKIIHFDTGNLNPRSTIYGKTYEIMNYQLNIINMDRDDILISMQARMFSEAHWEVCFFSVNQVRHKVGDGVQHVGGEEVRAGVQGRAGQVVQRL